MLLLPYQACVSMPRYPWANLGLIAVTSIISIVAIHQPQTQRKLMLGQRDAPQIRYDYALLEDTPVQRHHYPVEYEAGGYITYGFVHVGYVHLIGNMLFLFVFGNAVNAKLGHVRYLGLYILLLMASGAAQVRFIDVPMPIAGASGAIYGLMGLFIVFYPRNDISCFWFAFYRLSEHAGWFEISSIWIVLYWVICDAVLLALDLAGNIGIHAHLAGFITGAVIGIACLLTRWVESDECEARSDRNRN